MTGGEQFSRMAHAPERIPVWYWNRQVLLKLREAVRGFLLQAEVGDKSRTLELGCGNRPCEHIVLGLGARYEGADLEGNPHADHRIGPDGRVATGDAQFDTVLSIQVLEHVPDPGAHLAEARRLLKPGGKLILSTHGIWVYHPSPTDYWRWTEPGLRKLLEEHGFRILALRGVMGLVPGSLQLLQDQLRTRLPKPISRVLTTVMQALIGLLDRLHGEDGRRRNAMIYVALAEPRGA